MLTSLLTALIMSGTGGPDLLPQGTLLVQDSPRFYQENAELVSQLLKGPVDPFCDGCEFSHLIDIRSNQFTLIAISTSLNLNVPGFCVPDSEPVTSCLEILPCEGEIEISVSSLFIGGTFIPVSYQIDGGAVQNWTGELIYATASTSCGTSLEDPVTVAISYKGSIGGVVRTDYVDIYATCSPCEGDGATKLQFH